MKEDIKAWFAENESEIWMALLKQYGCFIKDEPYDELKPARQICAPDAFYKAFFGPITKEIEKVVYDHPASVKHLPVLERPDYICDQLDKGGFVVEGDDGLFYHPRTGYVVSDHSCFESAFTVLLKKAFMLVFYSHMLSPSADGLDFISMKKKVDCKKATLVFKKQGVVYTIEARTKSGSMDTALMNWLLNWCVISYTLKHLDGGGTADVAWFAAWGFRLKLKSVPTPGHASFCGLVFGEAREPIRDICVTLLKLGWVKMPYVEASDRTLRKLTRLKCLSFCFESPQCPILGVLCRRVIELTSDIRDSELMRYLSPWEKQRFVLNKRGLPPFKPHITTRDMVAELFDISVDLQLSLEEDLVNWELGPLPSSFENLPFNPEWERTWATYVTTSPKRVSF